MTKSIGDQITEAFLARLKSLIEEEDQFEDARAFFVDFPRVVDQILKSAPAPASASTSGQVSASAPAPGQVSALPASTAPVQASGRTGKGTGPLSGYNIFTSEMFDLVKKKLLVLPDGVSAQSHIPALWKGMNAGAKQPYVEKAELENVRRGATRGGGSRGSPKANGYSTLGLALGPLYNKAGSMKDASLPLAGEQAFKRKSIVWRAWKKLGLQAPWNDAAKELPGSKSSDIPEETKRRLAAMLREQILEHRDAIELVAAEKDAESA
ncbi:MAG: HMG-box domain-containing protein [Sulfobacillus sp.]